MIIKSSDVKSASQTLGTVEYPEFESLEEACNAETYGLGEAACLSLINAQNRTNKMNTFRTSMTKGPSKQQLRMDAMASIMEEFAAGAHQEIVGNSVALEAVVEKKMAEIEAERLASLGTVAEEPEAVEA